MDLSLILYKCDYTSATNVDFQKTLATGRSSLSDYKEQFKTRQLIYFSAHQYKTSIQSKKRLPYFLLICKMYS